MTFYGGNGSMSGLGRVPHIVGSWNFLFFFGLGSWSINESGHSRRRRPKRTALGVIESQQLVELILKLWI